MLFQEACYDGGTCREPCLNAIRNNRFPRRYVYPVACIVWPSGPGSAHTHITACSAASSASQWVGSALHSLRSNERRPRCQQPQSSHTIHVASDHLPNNQVPTCSSPRWNSCATDLSKRTGSCIPRLPPSNLVSRLRTDLQNPCRSRPVAKSTKIFRPSADFVKWEALIRRISLPPCVVFSVAALVCVTCVRRMGTQHLVPTLDMAC